MIIDAEQLPNDDARKAMVKQLTEEVKRDKKHWEKDFRAMRNDMRTVRTGCNRGWGRNDYVANITQRHVHNRTAALYAKNPKVIFRRRERIDHTVWDGTVEQVQAALQGVAMAEQLGEAPQPQAMMVIQDYVKVTEQRAVLDRVGNTLRLVGQYYIDEGAPKTQRQMKRLVRRVITTGVGYVKLGLQRMMEPNPDTEARIADVSNQLAHLERLTYDVQTGKVQQHEGEAAELRQMLEELQTERMRIVREGITYDFPGSTTIIPDRTCVCLNGFIGADRVAQELLLTKDEIKEIYQLDLENTGAVEHGAGSRTTRDHIMEEPELRGKLADDEVNGLMRVWIVWHKPSGLEMHICDGYDNFLREPAAPDVVLERFWPVFTLMFNEVEEGGEDTGATIFPQSDVSLMLPMQMEYNRSRQALREHRKANRPKWVSSTGALEEEDINKLMRHPNMALLRLQGLAPGMSVGDLLQAFPTIPIDPALYQTNHLMEDVQLVLGESESALGMISNATATEVTSADSSRVSGIESQQDELDAMLTELLHATGQVALQELSAETVKQIVGEGAVWPRLSLEQIIADVFLEVQAGSSGKPNRALEAANWERLLPIILQVPGISPSWLARESVRRIDDRVDLSEAVDLGMPSILSMNRMTQGSGATGTGADPYAQGAAGEDNAAQPAEPGGSIAPMGDNTTPMPTAPAGLAAA